MLALRGVLGVVLRAMLGAMLGGLLVGALSVGVARAQRILPGVRPGDAMPELQPFAPAAPPDTPILPPFPMPEPGGPAEIDTGAAIVVREIRITGNTVLPAPVLADLTAPYTGRKLTFADLAALRDRITLAYVERGFVSSGATLPDQAVENGVVEIRIIEGTLAEIDVETSGRFRPAYFRKRIRKRIEAQQSGVLNVVHLREQLELFQLDPRIEKVQASLVPSAERGQSRLQVSVLEAPFYGLSADFDNIRSPSIGALGGGAQVRIANAIGVGDQASTRFAVSEGLRQFQAQFALPINLSDTTLGAHYQYSQGDVVTGEFVGLGIQSESQTVGFELRQPLKRSLQTTVSAFLQADWRRSQSFLFDGAIGLPTAYSDQGISQVSVLRLGVDASYRTRSQSLAFRSQISWGIDALGATRSRAGIPDGEFVSWLAQLQWAARLPGTDAQLVARLDTQIASAPLLPLEQFSVGGLYTVRGYRENAAVRDNGLASSIELRLPIYQRIRPQVRVDLAPFLDVGRSWNDDERPGLVNSEALTLASMGLGLRVGYARWFQGEIYWGRRLKPIESPGSGDLQDDGIEFRLSVRWP